MSFTDWISILYKVCPGTPAASASMRSAVANHAATVPVSPLTGLCGGDHCEAGVERDSGVPSCSRICHRVTFTGEPLPFAEVTVNICELPSKRDSIDASCLET